MRDVKRARTYTNMPLKALFRYLPKKILKQHGNEISNTNKWNLRFDIKFVVFSFFVVDSGICFKRLRATSVWREKCDISKRLAQKEPTLSSFLPRFLCKRILGMEWREFPIERIRIDSHKYMHRTQLLWVNSCSQLSLWFATWAHQRRLECRQHFNFTLRKWFALFEIVSLYMYLWANLPEVFSG